MILLITGRNGENLLENSCTEIGIVINNDQHYINTSLHYKQNNVYIYIFIHIHICMCIYLLIYNLFCYHSPMKHHIISHCTQIHLNVYICTCNHHHIPMFKYCPADSCSLREDLPRSTEAFVLTIPRLTKDAFFLCFGEFQWQLYRKLQDFMMFYDGL